MIIQINKKCQCGCGKIVKYGNRWIHGHNSFGRKFSEKTREKIGLAHKGMKHSEESKKKMSRVGSYLKSEDHNQVEGASYAEYWNAKIEKETTEVRVGGATSSIKVTPNANCVANFPIMAMEWEESAVPAAEQTRGVAIKQGLADPTGFPTNVQLWLEAEYYNHATNCTVATAVSTATISVYNTWTWFPVTYTPAQVQKVRYRVWLGVKKSAEAYYIDNQLYDANPI